MSGYPDIIPAKEAPDLRRRLRGFFSDRVARPRSHPAVSHAHQSVFDLWRPSYFGDADLSARRRLIDFLDDISASSVKGDIYLFGGIIRDLAFCGRGGFCSDIDIVTDGSLENVVPTLREYGAKRNKFGGYRLYVGEWPVDIWSAQETWAIKRGLVPYNGIGSLLDTTVLNWDAILMNWRTGNLIFRPDYFESVNGRLLDIVLSDNPNRLGMLVRVLRQLVMKKGITTDKARQYLIDAATEVPYQDVKGYETGSYYSPVISKRNYDRFSDSGTCGDGFKTKALIAARENRLRSTGDMFPGQRSSL